MTANPPKVVLTADLIESFAGVFLSPRYDDPRPTAGFHRDAWELYCSPYPACGCVAPRDHAKSTALTFDYILAETLFRASDYVILIGSTEEMAAEQLSNIAEELQENEDIHREFGEITFERRSTTDIIAKMADGHRFRILARGSEQKIRGRMWKGKRPNLLVCDDLEDDEQVENKDRRVKFRKWFFRAAKQALSKTGKIRIHGTILHEDSLLSRLLKNSEWRFLFYKAHRSFDDFSGILWPERWSEAQLRSRQREFIQDGDAAGYAQEFLNDPIDSSEAYLRADDFIPMTEGDKECFKEVACGWDFAVSKADLANRTSCTVGGKDLRNVIHFVDFYVGRWSPTVSPREKAQGEFGWIDLMFDVEQRYSPRVHYVEGGVIWQSVEATLYTEMQVRDLYLNIEVLAPIKDKATRGLSLRKRHRAGATRWNCEAAGFAEAKYEMLRFTGTAAARLDDQFDSAATLCLGFELAPLLEDEDAMEEEELDMIRHDPRKLMGRSAQTGY